MGSSATTSNTSTSSVMRRGKPYTPPDSPFSAGTFIRNDTPSPDPQAPLLPSPFIAQPPKPKPTSPYSKKVFPTKQAIPRSHYVQVFFCRGNSEAVPQNLRREVTGASCIEQLEAEGRLGEHLGNDDLIEETFMLGSSLRQRDLSFAYLVHISLRKHDFFGAMLNSARLYKAGLKGSTFYKACLTNCDLRFADFRSTDCTGADFRHSELAGINFHRARLTNAMFTGKQVKQLLQDGFRRFAGICLMNADLQGVDFTGLDLTGVDFTCADLRDAKFNNCVLKGAIFDGADLTGTDFSGAEQFDPPAQATPPAAAPCP